MFLKRQQEKSFSNIIHAMRSKNKFANILPIFTEFGDE